MGDVRGRSYGIAVAIVAIVAVVVAVACGRLADVADPDAIASADASDDRTQIETATDAPYGGVIDAPFDADPNANDPRCPISFAEAGLRSCEAAGLVCTYPEGTCKCHGWCKACVPLPCTFFLGTCGPMSDGCGGVVDRPCDAGADGATCIPKTCETIGPSACGSLDDGCGSCLDCGPCLQWDCTDECPDP